jgi:hypothetical protein
MGSAKEIKHVSSIFKTCVKTHACCFMYSAHGTYPLVGMELASIIFSKKHGWCE